MTTDKKPTSPADVTAMIKENGILMIDLKFCDLPGTWQHFTLPLIEYRKSSLKRAPALTVPPSEGSSRFMRATC